MIVTGKAGALPRPRTYVGQAGTAAAPRSPQRVRKVVATINICIVVTGNIHDRGGECWQSSGGGICFRNTFSSSNGQYGGSSSLPVTPVTPVTSFCNRLNIYTKSTHYCTCLYFINGMIYLITYIYEYIYICVYLIFPVGGVVVVAVGYTRACIHLWPVWSGHTCIFICSYKYFTWSDTRPSACLI